MSILYKWESAAFADYSNGNIIVMASSVDVARRRVLNHYKNHSRIDMIKLDIKEKPEKIISGVIHTMGSA